VVDTTLVNVCVRAVAVVSVRGRWRGNQVHLMCCRRRHQVVGTALVNVRAVVVVSMRGRWRGGWSLPYSLLASSSGGGHGTRRHVCMHTVVVVSVRGRWGDGTHHTCCRRRDQEGEGGGRGGRASVHVAGWVVAIVGGSKCVK